MAAPMEVINLSRAKCGGVLPGKSGMVDPENPSVKAYLAGGLLVDAKAHRAALLKAAGGDKELDDARAEIERLKAQLAAQAAPAAPSAPARTKREG